MGDAGGAPHARGFAELSRTRAAGRPRASVHCVPLVLSSFVLASVAVAQPFHTSPECWAGPRLYHAGPPAPELAANIHVVELPPTTPPGEAIVSPNGAYRMWVRQPASPGSEPQGAGLIFAVERPTQVGLMFENVAGPLAPRWINEKLVFVRVMWGRIVFTDVLFDVERREILYSEEVRDGTIAFEQFRDACAGRCPCEATADASASDGPLPSSKPAGDAWIGLLELPELFGPGETGGLVGAVPRKPVDVYAEPSATAAVVLRTTDFRDFEHREISYEKGAAVVTEHRSGWVRVTLAGQAKRGWVALNGNRTFHDLAKLLPERQTYLNEHWDRRVWNAVDGGATAMRIPAREGRPEYPMDVREVRETDSGIWLRVALFAHDPCEGGDSGIATEGWVPAYSQAGRLVAWFHSRGC